MIQVNAAVPETGLVYASRELALAAALGVAKRYKADLLGDTHRYNQNKAARSYHEETRYYVALGFFEGLLPEVLSIVAKPIVRV